jgi:hypothetical protein
MSFAAITGAAKGQGLAGGAIVFMYGIFAAFAGLLAAVVYCYHADQLKIKKANRILAVVLIVLIAGISVRVYLKEILKKALLK